MMPWSASDLGVRSDAVEGAALLRSGSCKTHVVAVRFARWEAGPPRVCFRESGINSINSMGLQLRDARGAKIAKQRIDMGIPGPFDDRKDSVAQV
jgi:hypothetical protein